MKRIPLLLLLMLGACASPRGTQEQFAGAAPPVAVHVSVLRKGEAWTADFRFNCAAPSMGVRSFPRHP